MLYPSESMHTMDTLCVPAPRMKGSTGKIPSEQAMLLTLVRQIQLVSGREVVKLMSILPSGSGLVTPTMEIRTGPVEVRVH